jgi:hemolysin III
MSLKQPYPQKDQDPLSEVLVNGVSHGLGAALSIAGMVLLIIRAVKYGDVWHIVSFSIFGSTLIILYLASTLYHSLLVKPNIRKYFRILDHSAIYLLIAGTYTPFMLVNLRGPWGWTILSVIWALALLGITGKFFFLMRCNKLSTVLYVIMGWLCVIAGKELIANVPRLSLMLLAAGGLAYTLGLIFYGWRKLPYHHAVWHLFVLSGSIFHYFSVFYTL